MQTQINKWGNSAAVRIPAGVLSEAGLTVNSNINIEVKDGLIVIEPVQSQHRGLHLPFTEATLLAGLDAHTAHADEAAVPLAAELGE